MIKYRFFTFHFSLFTLVLLATSCVCDEDFEDTNSDNFECLWKVMDEHYCFFQEKQQLLGVDWNEVHDRYRQQVEGADKYQLFEVLSNMIGELKDGHVNLSSGWDMSRNWTWKEDYPTNFSDSIYRKYMGTDYRISSGIQYRILDNNSGYMRVSTFDTTFGDGNLDEMFLYFAGCDRLIVDIRSNGGGKVTSAEKLAARFTDEKVLVGYMQHKTGTGHNDFSDRQEVNLEPSKCIRWHKKVIVLTNRGVFSAANEFTTYMKGIESSRGSKGVNGSNGSIVILGDRTGGGAGLPFSSELPNGWGIRFSACPMYDVNGTSTESGIDPDIHLDITPDDYSKYIDTILEKAKTL